ncbi:MAG: hypothetical protein KAU52_08080, partial [Methanosarcinales archaeon]|nr:hypothetical protein [Methanosarcinales archaeon]
TTDFAAAINDWMDCHNATGGTYEVPFLLHSDSSGAINVTNLRIEATPSLNENLDMLLPDFVEYNVIFAYLDTLLKGYLYTFSDGSFEKTLNFTGNENHTVHILLPNNTTSVYQANMDVTGLPYEPIEEYALPGISFAQGADTAIVVDSDGNVHIAYSRNNPQLDYITNEGEVWSGSQDINNGGGSTNNISMTIDSDDELHAAFIKGVANPDVYYTRTCDGEWLSSTILVNESDDNEPSYHPSQPCIAVDSGNDAHIVWIENASIYYSENTAGTWSPAVRLNNTINATRPLFDIDSDDIKHIAFLENKTAYYLNTSGGNWGIPVHVGSSTNASDMSMSLDFHGSTHLAWVENGTTLYYSNNTIGSWSYKEMVRNVTIVISEPSLDTDYTGNAYLVWAEADGATSYIYYSTNAAGSWSDPPMQLGGGDAIDPSVCIDIDIHGNI